MEQHAAPTIHVLLDTSELFDDLRIRGTAWEQLLRLNQAGSVLVHVPEVVIAECARHYRREVRKALKAAESPLGDLRKLGVDIGAAPPSTARLAADDVIAKYETALRLRLIEHAAHICPLPSIQHEKLLNDLLNERKPFKQQGEGYRDALVWATAVELAATLDRDNLLLIVTSNEKDFANSSRTDLAEDLRSDLEASAHEVPVKWCRTRDDAVDTINDTIVGRPDEASEAEESTDEAAVSDPDRPTLSEVVADAVEAHLENMLGEEVAWQTEDDDIEATFEMHIPGDVDVVSIYTIEVFRESIVIDIYEEFDDGTVLLHAEVEADIVFDAFMDKSSYYGSHEVYALDPDWNNHVAWVAFERRMRLRFGVRANSDTEFAEVMELEDGEELAEVQP